MLTLVESKKFIGLTAADLHLFERVAHHMIACRKWVQVKRRHQNDFDFFDICRCGASGTEFSIGRRTDGVYILIDHCAGTTWTADSLGGPLRQLVCHSAETAW